MCVVVDAASPTFARQCAYGVRVCDLPVDVLFVAGSVRASGGGGGGGGGGAALSVTESGGSWRAAAVARVR